MAVLEDLKNMVLNMSEKVAFKMKTKDRIIKQLDKRLQNVATPDVTKEIPIEERLKNLQNKGRGPS